MEKYSTENYEKKFIILCIFRNSQKMNLQPLADGISKRIIKNKPIISLQKCLINMIDVSRLF